MNMLRFDLSVLLVVFLPAVIQGFAPPDPFKAQRTVQQDGCYNFLRPGSPPMSVSGSQPLAFSFSFSHITSKEKNKSEAMNRTLLDDDNIHNKTSHEMIIGNATNSTNTTSANQTTSKSNTNTNDLKSKVARGRLGVGSYFPFSFQPQPTAPKKPPKVANVNKSAPKKALTVVNKKEKTKTDRSNIYFHKTKKNNYKNENNSTKATSLLNKQANETITVADLEVLLSQMQSNGDFGKSIDGKKLKKYSATAAGKKGTTTSSGSSSSQVAFPQPSEVSELDVRRSTAITSCFVGMIVGITILPNLWLVGMVAGVLYGFDITKDLDEYKRGEKNSLANFLISIATRLAVAYRKAVDGMKALWFLYKTGQLSYEYYKSYETLDKKFAIQQKVDAWNRVFVKGKEKFDTWEKENEVGRKVLAGLRTVWLVDEKSRQRAAGKSQYRLLQWFYNLRRSTAKLLKKTMKSIRSLFEEGGLEKFWKGLQADLQTEGSLRFRIGAVAAAIAAVNVFGALFSLSAGFSNLLAIAVAVIWPSWTTDLFSRSQEIWLDIQSRGNEDANRSNGAFNPFECIQNLYEEHSSANVRQSRRKQKTYRKPNRRAVTKRKTRKPNTRQNQTNQSWFGFGSWRKKGKGRNVNFRGY